MSIGLFIGLYIYIKEVGYPRHSFGRRNRGYIYYSSTTTTPITTAMALTSTTYFGHRRIGVPEFGIFIADESRDICRGIYSGPIYSEVVETFNPSWTVFDQFTGYEQLKKNCATIEQHYETITINLDQNCLDRQIQFGFYLDNLKDHGNEHAIAYIYSNQERKMAFKGFIATSGTKGGVLRFRDEDKAFCLTANPKSMAENQYTISPKELYLQSSKEDVCSFMIMTTRVKENPRKENYYVDACVDGLQKDQTDGGSIAEKSYHTNLIRGQKTNQTFTRMDVTYNGAMFSIYNVVILSILT